jgi:Protein of unknown function (DUF3606)
MSLSISTAARSSPRYTEFVDFRDMRRFDDWCKTLGVTRNQLLSVVSEVGGNADAVRIRLGQRRG